MDGVLSPSLDLLWVLFAGVGLGIALAVLTPVRRRLRVADPPPTPAARPPTAERHTPSPIGDVVGGLLVLGLLASLFGGGRDRR
jgi:hypothetical protein